MTQQRFNRNKVRAAFDRAVDSYDDAAFLQKEVCQRLLEKLDIVNIAPRRVLDAGTGTGEAVRDLHRRFPRSEIVLLDISENMLARAVKRGSILHRPRAICGDIEHLPFADASLDLVFSNLALQWCNDIDASLTGFRRVLRPGGLLTFTTFGPDTLKELRASWSKIDEGQHVNHFLDMHDVGDALVRSGFAEPVMEAEVITVNYQTVDRLMHDLKDIGANVVAGEGRRTGLNKAGLSALRAAYEVYRRGDMLPASYEIVYGHAWVPEDTQGGGVRVELT